MDLGSQLDRIDFRVHASLARGLGRFVGVVVAIAAVLVAVGLGKGDLALRNLGVFVGSLALLAAPFWLVSVVAARVNIVGIDVHDRGLVVRYRRRREIVRWPDIEGINAIWLPGDRIDAIHVRARRRPIQLSRLHQGADEVERLLAHVARRP